MIFGLKEKSFKVEDATFYTNELSKDEYFEYTGFDNLQKRYDFAIARITKVENLLDVDNKPVTFEQVKACANPAMNFMFVFTTAYGSEIVFGDLNKQLTKKAETAEKKEESPTA